MTPAPITTVRGARTLLLLTALLFLSGTLRAQYQEGFRENININPNCNGLVEYLPEGYSSGSNYPVLVFFMGINSHGAGTRASMESKFFNTGGRFIQDAMRAGTFPASFTVGGQTHKFIVIIPQFVTDYNSRPPTPGEVDDVIEYVKRNYKVNNRRIYLTGNSSGGGPVWEYPGASSQYANKVAAILPFCGVSYPTYERADKIKHAGVGVWAFHNQFDGGVPASFTTDYVAFINRPPAPVVQAKATTFPQSGHDCWGPAYNNQYTENNLNIYQWMLQFERPATGVNAGNDIDITLPANSANLSGTGGSSWSQVSGPSTATITSPSSSSTSVTNLVAGTYVFRLSGSGTDDVAVTVYPARTEAENYTAMSGVNTEATQDEGGGQNVGSFDGGDWVEYSVNVPAAGTYPLRLRVAAFYFGAKLEVRNSSGGVISAFDVWHTGNWQRWQTQTVSLNLPAGQQTIRLQATGASFNLNWIQLMGGSSGTPPPPPPNQNPTANAGGDQTITLPTSSVTLSGSGNDPDGSIASYSWSKISGGNASIGSPSSASTSVSGLQQGTYVFRLTVTDDRGATATDDVQVTVNQAPNNNPTANAGADQTVTLPSGVTLSGSGADSDGSITSYAWTKVSGGTANFSNASAASTSVSGLQEGVYVFRLTVTDNRGGTASDDVQVTVNPAPNQNPTANAGTDQGITLPTSSVTLSGSGSDGDGFISGYSWTKVSGGNASIGSPSSASTSVSGLQEGTYVFRLTVTDNRGGTASDDVTVTVYAAPPPPNQNPSANAGADQTVTLPNGATLSGSGSDPDGSITSYSWTKVSGGTATIASPNTASTSVTGLQQGTYVFRLTVGDNRGGTASDDVTVTVNPAPPTPNTNPTANAGTDQTITLPSSSVTLSGSGADSDGSVTAYSWTKISGGSATIGSPSSPSTSVTGLTEGTYTFRLTVTDNRGGTGVDDVLVTVRPAPPTGSGTPVPGRVEAEAYTSMSGVQKENTSDAGGGQNVGYIDVGDWMDYSVNAASAGVYTVSFRIASGNGGGQLQLRNAAGAAMGTATIPNTGGWQNWQTVSITVNLVAGQQTLRIHDLSGNWNVNWIDFIPASQSAAMATAQGEAPASDGVQVLSLTDGRRFLLRLPPGQPGAVGVQVTDSNGALRRTYNLMKGSGQQQAYFTMEGLPAGTYVVVVKYGDLITRKLVVKLP